ncbi:MAG: amidase [Bacteroidota bacterium]
MSVSRRDFLAVGALIGVGAPLGVGPIACAAQTPANASTPLPTPDENAITVEAIAEAETLLGLTFTPDERELMLGELRQAHTMMRALRKVEVPNEVPPAVLFDPAVGGDQFSREGPVSETDQAIEYVYARPSDEDLAFASVHRLMALLRGGYVSSVELTQLALDRLKRLDPELLAVVTLTEERALEQARRADAELAAGERRGPLHGIPYGAKDLLAVRGIPTTWGATPYRDQVIDTDAAVIEKLDAAGAVLVAKLSLGALAMGDVWYGGTTKSPWNTDVGSSGSSAGPGAAVAAGALPFAIGSETYGSIVSPSTRNGITGFRPTFGTVSRHGAMALSWSMDKLGPMTRSALDAALVYDAIRGADSRDPTTRDVPFALPRDVTDLRVAYVADLFEESDRYTGAGRALDLATLDAVRSLGVALEPIAWPSDLPVEPLLMVLMAEAAAAFDDLTRSGTDDLLVAQHANAWPNFFRAARFIPAVEYVQANRVRTMLLRAVAAALDGFDVVLAPAFNGPTLLLTNLTGHPAVCVPNGFLPVNAASSDVNAAFADVNAASEDDPRRSPHSITFIGGLYRDAAALRLAMAYQQVTDFHLRRPPVR